MVIFATPDFGASGVIMLFWLIVAGTVLALAAGGLFIGAKLLGSDAAGRRKIGVALIAASCLFPLFCYYAPTLAFRWTYGSYPIRSYPNEIREGMSAKEVEELLGPPTNAPRIKVENRGSTGSIRSESSGAKWTSGPTGESPANMETEGQVAMAAVWPRPLATSEHPQSGKSP
jgi:hypothetical protein